MDNRVFTNAEVADLAQKLKVICEPNRLLLLEKIIQGVQCNCELGSDLQLAPNLISHHLAVLRDAGLINAERDPGDARWVYYSINPAALQTLQTLFGAFFDVQRLQPRRNSCGPQVMEGQRQSYIRIAK